MDDYMIENKEPKKLVGRIMYTKYLKEKGNPIKPITIFVEYTDATSYNVYYNLFYIKEKRIINVGFDHKHVNNLISSLEENKFTEKENYNSEYIWMII